MRRVVTRVAVILTAMGFGITVGGFVPQVSQPIRNALLMAGLRAEEQTASLASSKASTSNAGDPGRLQNGSEPQRPDGFVKMSAAQIEAASIEVAPLGKGELTRKLVVPGTVTPNGDKIARVPVRVVGTVGRLD